MHIEVCKEDEVFGMGSSLISRLIAAGRAGHLCIKECEADCEVQELNGHEEWFEKKVGCWRGWFYLQKNWVLENRVVNEWKRLLKEDVQKINFKLHGLNPGQNSAIKIGLSEGVFCLSGGPGTGKSYTIGKIIEAFRGSVCVCAPTGKAVALLKEKFNVNVAVGTLHRMLKVKSGKDLLFGEEMLNYDMVIVDECSMIDIAMWARLLRSIKNGTRLILVGDHNQLPPVEAGSVYEELCNYMCERKRGYIYLNECMRSDRKEIIDLAEKVKKGEVIKYENLENGIEDYFAKGYQLLSSLRQGKFGVEKINSLLSKNEGPIIITRSNPKMGFFNGEIGYLRNGEIMLGKKCFKKERVMDYEPAYCLSVHKSQGSEFEKVALILPKGSEVFGKELLYTGITRAKSEILIFSEEGVINECVKNSTKRMSGIKEKLECNF